MPPSQLKQLKASLRDSGVVGPQQSKKQKRQNAKSGAAAQNRNQRNAALQAIRDRFNPFEIKVPSNRSKFDATTRDGNSTAAVRSRPGVTKSLGEERRRATLLQEMNTRNKVGGLIDRRFGENDPTMTPEERAAERFARENQKKMRKESMFNLEDEEDEFQLTHLGQSLSFDEKDRDDFEMGGSGPEDGESDDETTRKRKRFVEADENEEDFIDNPEGEDLHERKKSKAEVMKEVIAKSKFYKHERQKAKEDDDDLRDELDQELPDLFEALRGMKAPAKPEPPKQDLDTMNPERAAMLQGPEKTDAEKEYDQRLKQLTFDKRSQPTDRTKTEEEKIEEEAERLKKLEEDRMKRMRGEQVSDEEDEDQEVDKDSFFNDDEEDSDMDDATAFGLPSASYEQRQEMGVEDEDDFVIDDDLVETRSNVSLSVDGSDMEESELSDEDESEQSEQEDELINGMSLPAASAASTAVAASQTADGKLAFTYPCPDTHDEFVALIKGVPSQDVPTIIQRIRALHHPRLHPDNKAKLGRFSEILVEHVSYMANEPEVSFILVENILRHVHSLAKTHPINVSMAFRARLREISKDRPLNLRPGDLAILTGISTVFPTSDHFHAVSTPAHLCLARFLGQCSANTLSDFAIGAYSNSLILQYQAVAKRYMPELVNYVLGALCNLAPTEPTKSIGSFPYRKTQESVRLVPSKKVTPRKLQFRDLSASPSEGQAQEELKMSLVTTFVSLLDTASDLWAEKSAFTEIFTPVREVLSHLQQSFKSKVYTAARDSVQSTLDKITSHLDRARLARRPLLLHDHRPLAIKSAIPKFEENFNPDKHYDPDRERAENNRLKAEIKRERKGAMRELRKDASFVAREKLREKKERDAEYEKKYKRLVAEIQNEEGRAANDYEKERRARQGKH